MSIVEFDWPPYWSLGARETRESTKCPWVVAVGLIGCGRRAEKIGTPFVDLAKFHVHRVFIALFNSNQGKLKTIIYKTIFILTYR